MNKVPEDPWKALAYYHKTILGDMNDARKSADALELLVDQQYWPFPVYSDLLFSE
jgi:glutamine synthetase